MEILFAGFGGQGVQTAGMILAGIAAEQGLEVLFTPSFSGEVRGGISTCVVKYGRDPIFDPYRSKPDVLIAMDEASLAFGKDLKEDGLLIVNSSLAGEKAAVGTGARILSVPMSELAAEAGNEAGTGIAAIGALIAAVNDFDKEQSVNVMCSFFEEKGKGGLNERNRKVFEAGFRSVRERNEKR